MNKKEKNNQDLIELSLGNKQSLIDIKNVLVKLEQFDAAKKFEDTCNSIFKETPKVMNDKKLISNLVRALHMSGINISEQDCYIIYKTFERYKKINKKFNLEEAEKIRYNSEKAYFVKI